MTETEIIQIPRQVGSLTVLRPTADTLLTGYFDCQCACGKVGRVWGRKLAERRVTSCGCTDTPEHPYYTFKEEP